MGWKEQGSTGTGEWIWEAVGDEGVIWWRRDDWNLLGGMRGGIRPINARAVYLGASYVNLVSECFWERILIKKAENGTPAWNAYGGLNDTAVPDSFRCASNNSPIYVSDLSHLNNDH